MTDAELRNKCIELSYEAERLIYSILQQRGYASFSDIPVTFLANNSILNLAWVLAQTAHRGQFDKGGQPYILHVYTVGSLFRDPARKSIGYMHDILEDTIYTATDLKASGIPPEILQPLQLLCRTSSDEYFDYIKRVCTNPLAADVKLADLWHNTRAERLNTYDMWTYQRMQKYVKAIKTVGKTVWRCKL